MSNNVVWYLEHRIRDTRKTKTISNEKNTITLTYLLIIIGIIYSYVIGSTELKLQIKLNCSTENSLLNYIT